MLEIKFVRDHLDDIETMLLNRRSTADLSQFKAADDKRREILFKIEDLRHRRNVVSDQIADMKKKGQNADALVADMRNVAKDIKALELPLSENEEQTRDILMQIPNLPHASVPVGNDSSENPIIKTAGNRPDFEFEPKPHWTIGEQLGILDLDRATKITGTRFPLYYGAGARLERALINFMLDMHTHEHGYKEVLPPFIVNATSMTNTGQLPKFKEDLFKIEEWPYYLVPTAEVPVTNIHQGEILDESDLPILYAAHTPCFRSEAGSYGKDTRGLIRQHQFNKVELVKFTTPENSYTELESLLHNAEAILSSLDLPYQIITLCTGDLGFSSAKTYDIEVWLPYQNAYREISSCSNFEDFQSRRANIRFRRKGKKGTELVHTLNGSGLAVGRTVAAILENCQQADGTVIIPKALRSYMGDMKTIEP